MSRGPDAAALLERALGKAAETAGIALAVSDAGWTRWASATFTGARHRLTLRAEANPAIEAWAGTLAEHEFSLPGNLVADLTVTAMRRRPDAVEIDIEALTVEDR